MTLLDEKL